MPRLNRRGISPHTLRHTKAMHLLQSGVPVITIKDVLGHADVKSTEVYVQTDLEETLTVVRLGLAGALRRTLATTNPIESALSVTRRVTALVTRWRDGDMRRRWCVAGL